MGDLILNFIQFSINIWNSSIKMLLGTLKQSPIDINEGAAWERIMEIDWIFVGVGANLIVVFMLIAFCSESIDFKDSFRIENMFGYFIKLSIAEAMVIFHAEIVQGVFKIVGGMIGLFIDKDSYEFKLTAEQKAAFRALNVDNWYEILDILAGLVVLLVALLVFLVMLVFVGMIFFVAYFRFIKILILVPYGALAFSTVSGNRLVNDIASSYFKSMLMLVLDGLTMALALIVCNAFMSNGTVLTFETGTILSNISEGWLATAEVLIYMFEILITSAITVGMVSGADRLTRRVFSIYG